jgi:hypothetical protein
VGHRENLARTDTDASDTTNLPAVFGRLLINTFSSPPIDHYPHLTRAIMSNLPSSSTSRSNLDSIFNAALKSYKKKTGKDITSHPLANELQSCDSPDAILAVLRRQIPTPDQSQTGDETFEKCLTPVVNILYTLSDTLGEGVGLVISTMSSPVKNPCANIFLTGVLTSQSNICGYWYSSLGRLSIIFYFRCVAHFDVWRF